MTISFYNLNIENDNSDNGMKNRRGITIIDSGKEKDYCEENFSLYFYAFDM